MSKRRRRRRKKKAQGVALKRKSAAAAPTSNPPKVILSRALKMVVWLCVSLVPAVVTILYVPPSIQFGLPSSAIRSGNPYTALFSLTNTGWGTASGVTVHCLVRDVEYPGDLHSSNLPTFEPVGAIPHGEARTFNCPQLLSHFEIIPKALTPQEAQQMYENTRTHDEDAQGRWIGPDMKFVWVDLQFQVTYSFLFQHSDTFRVVGKPNEAGAFVWEQVPLDRQFDEAHKHHPEWGDR